MINKIACLILLSLKMIEDKFSPDTTSNFSLMVTISLNVSDMCMKDLKQLHGLDLISMDEENLDVTPKGLSLNPFYTE